MIINLLFYILLILFIICLLIVFINKKFRTVSHIVILGILLFGLIFLSQKGSKTLKFGPLEVTTEEINKEAKFEIRNTANENVKKEIGFATSDIIDNIRIDKGNDFLSVVNGGVGNNYIVYSVEIPANQIASGSIVTLNRSGIIPQELIKETTNTKVAN